MAMLGFDMAKKSAVAVRVDEHGREEEKVTIENTRERLGTALHTWQKQSADITVTVEATGDCHRTLALLCLEQGIPCRILNPITTKQYTRSTVRKKKTDPSDALAIARLGLQGEGSLARLEQFGPALPLSRTGEKLSDLSLTLKRLEHHLRETAAGIPVTNEGGDVVQLIATCRTTLERAARQTRKAAESQVDQTKLKLLQTIPGIGPIISVTFLCEIGDIARFPSEKKFIAYTGLDPRVRQSGTTLNRNTHLTRRGSPYLRKGLFLAAHVASLHDPVFSRYYQAKRAEGKSYTEATVATARKLAKCLYAVWKQNQPYTCRPPMSVA